MNFDDLKTDLRNVIDDYFIETGEIVSKVDIVWSATKEGYKIIDVQPLSIEAPEVEANAR